MKKAMLFPIIFAFLFFIGSAMAIDKSLTFEWGQNAASITQPAFAGWKLYHAVDQPGGPYTLFATILYDGQQQTVYSSTQSITVPANESHTHYFVLTAFNDVSGAIYESEYSNEANAVIETYVPPSIPFNFTITINTQ